MKTKENATVEGEQLCKMHLSKSQVDYMLEMIADEKETVRTCIPDYEDRHIQNMEDLSAIEQQLLLILENVYGERL